MEDEREREAGRSPSEQTVLTEVQEEDEAPRSPDDIILPTIPLRDETDEGRLVAGQRGRQRERQTVSVNQENAELIKKRDHPDRTT